MTISRRGLVGLLGFGGLAVGGGVGIFLMLNDEGPANVAEAFITALAESDFDEANDLILPAARIDNADVAIDLIASYTGVDVIFHLIEPSVERTATLSETDSTAQVAVTVAIEMNGEQATFDIPVRLRTADGNWRVYGVA